uniref:Uncharacterized protein n=1 Tax=viral metagenome TaxID=1070528 RepID=A0A6M3JI39_9ZZZZ
MKIKSIKVYDKVLKDGTKSAGVTFDDEVFGFYNFKGEIDIKEGEDVNYTYETRQKKDKSGDYKVLTITRPNTPDPAPQATPEPVKVVTPSTERLLNAKSFTEMKFESRMNVIKLAVSAYIAGKIDFDQVKEHFNTWVDMADSAIDELKE